MGARMDDRRGGAMNSLNRKAFRGLLILFAVMAALLFAIAGTLNYWQAWLFLAVYFAASLAITLYLMRYDPELLARRMSGGPTAEKEPAQKIIMWFASLGFVGLLIVPALDHRFGWSHMRPAVAVAGDALMAAGWLAIYFVFKENTFTSATIELAPIRRSSRPVRTRWCGIRCTAERFSCCWEFRSRSARGGACWC
jgi:hypothetical protein